MDHSSVLEAELKTVDTTMGAIKHIVQETQDHAPQSVLAAEADGDGFERGDLVDRPTDLSDNCCNNVDQDEAEHSDSMERK